jgi:hypothetical protein
MGEGSWRRADAAVKDAQVNKWGEVKGCWYSLHELEDLLYLGLHRYTARTV